MSSLVKRTSVYSVYGEFLPERDYLTFGVKLGICYHKSVCPSSVTFVHPTQGLKLSAVFLCYFVPFSSFDLCAKTYTEGIKHKSGTKIAIEQW